jgi:hypothetical protein
MSEKTSLLDTLQKKEEPLQEVFYFRSFKPSLKFKDIMFTNYQLVTSVVEIAQVIREKLVARNLVAELTPDEFEKSNTISD